jgi:hypothetical protein
MNIWVPPKVRNILTSRATTGFSRPAPWKQLEGSQQSVEQKNELERISRGLAQYLNVQSEENHDKSVLIAGRRTAVPTGAQSGNDYHQARGRKIVVLHDKNK